MKQTAYVVHRAHKLAALSRISGGEERLDLTQVWDAPRRPAFRDLRPILLVVLLPILGLIIWFLAGPRNQSQRN